MTLDDGRPASRDPSDADGGPLLPLYLPRLAGAFAGPAARPNRVPALPTPLAFRAGTDPPALPAVPPYLWRSPDGREAVLAVPQIAPPDRTLVLALHPGDDLVGQPVLLGGLRGTVAAGGVVAFDWDDVVAVGAMAEHLAVGIRPVWICLNPSTGGEDGRVPDR